MDDDDYEFYKETFYDLVLLAVFAAVVGVTIYVLSCFGRLM